MKTEQKRFHLFGDESQYCGAIVYSLVIVPTRIRDHVESEIVRIKGEFGLKADDKIHCREIFNENAKRKTPLKHLAKDEIFALLRALLVGCKTAGAHMWVGHVNNKNVPDVLIFEGHDKAKVSCQRWDIRDVKVKMAFAYYAAMMPVLGVLIHEKCTAWVDGDTSKIAHFMSSKQANTLKSFFPINHNDKQFSPIPVKDNKPPLIEIADILAYAAAHDLSTTQTNDKQYYKSMLDETIGYSELTFNLSPKENGGEMSRIRVPDNHDAALKKFAKDASDS